MRPRDLILFEDDHLLVIDKPAGINTHSPSPYAGEGIYDWLRHREPRWASLAIIHRLDKGTSGVLLFSKSSLGNHSLTEQFTRGTVCKKYLFVTDRASGPSQCTASSKIEKKQNRFVSQPSSRKANAVTHFQRAGTWQGHVLYEATPETGKSHQIRLHAADQGIPILGDPLYGGTKAARLFLHAKEICLQHPATHQDLKFSAEPAFAEAANLNLRRQLIPEPETNACRWVHGAADGWPGWYVDRVGDFMLSQSESELTNQQKAQLAEWISNLRLHGAYHKQLNRSIGRKRPEEVAPQWVMGEACQAATVIRENQIHFELRFDEGYSTGVFLDQRDNRRRLLTRHVGRGFELHAGTPGNGELLNTFAYTCAFSVCAAKAGWRVTSLDLSKKYLDWGKRNFLLNDLPPEKHDFIYGDVFDWIGRLAKKGRRFEAIILDPPTFSRSKQWGTFQAEKDYGKLTREVLPLLLQGGVLLASCNTARLPPSRFVETIHESVRSSRRQVVQFHYAPQPPDFPVNPEESAYLKTVWLRVD